MKRKTINADVTEFGQAIGLLLRRMRAASGSHELSWSEASVMKRLSADGPATTADLARAEGVRPQSMRATITALEEMGFIERKPHPTDGRQMNIKPTTKGAAVQKRARDARWAWLAQAIAQLDAPERQTLFAAGEIIKHLAKDTPHHSADHAPHHPR